MKYTSVGADIAKNVFQVYWVDANTAPAFRADDVSSLDAQQFDAGRILSTDQVTNTYLLATSDRRLVVYAVPDGVSLRCLECKPLRAFQITDFAPSY